MANRALSCACKSMTWQVADRAGGSHVVCYCKDCQAFANALGQSGMLDAQGGTAIFQTLPADVTLLCGQQHLACLRLGPKGLLRWYADCCNTPIGNTLPRPGLPFVGMVLPQRSMGFGKVIARVNTATARAPVHEHGFARAGAALMLRALRARVTGRATSPFFDETGQPVVTPRVMTREERANATP